MILQNHLYAMRHGQSANNVLGVESCLTETQHQYGLTQLGKAQAEASAAEAPHFDAIYSSPFRRAQETAAIMATASEIEVITDSRLREFKLPSSYDGQPYKIAEAMIHDPFTDLNNTPIEDSETFSQMRQRLKTMLQEIDQKHQNAVILLVSHGSPVEALIQIMKNQNSGFGPFTELPKNAELFHLNSLNLIA